MGYIELPKRPTGWRYEGWRSCRDLEEENLEQIPRWFRCMESRCNRLVTHGQVSLGGCICGNRRLTQARLLTWMEILLVKLGWFPLDSRERKSVAPLMPKLAYSVRPRLVKVK